MLIPYLCNNLDIYDYVGKFPEQHFSVWLFSNQGDKILLLLKLSQDLKVELKTNITFNTLC